MPRLTALSSVGRHESHVSIRALKHAMRHSVSYQSSSSPYESVVC